jgi:hypothetical protein
VVVDVAVGDLDLTDHVAQVIDPVVEGVQVQWAGAGAYLWAPPPEPGTAPGSGAEGWGTWRVQDGRAETLAEPLDCSTPLAFAAAADTDGQIFTACALPGQDPASVSDAGVWGSTTGGRTWGSPGGGFAALSGDGVLMASTDADHVLVVTRDEVLLSDDGGMSWHEPSTPLPLTSPSLLSLTAEPGGVLVAVVDQTVAGTGSPGYWTSTDDGETWERVDLLP